MLPPKATNEKTKISSTARAKESLVSVLNAEISTLPNKNNKTTNDTPKMRMSMLWTDHLRKTWKSHTPPQSPTDTPRREDFVFAPPNLKDLSLSKLLRHGKEGVHYASGWDGLCRMIDEHGEDYEPRLDIPDKTGETTEKPINHQPTTPPHNHNEDSASDTSSTTTCSPRTVANATERFVSPDNTATPATQPNSIASRIASAEKAWWELLLQDRHPRSTFPDRIEALERVVFGSVRTSESLTWNQRLESLEPEVWNHRLGALEQLWGISSPSSGLVEVSKRSSLLWNRCQSRIDALESLVFGSVQSVGKNGVVPPNVRCERLMEDHWDEDIGRAASLWRCEEVMKSDGSASRRQRIECIEKAVFGEVTNDLQTRLGNLLKF